MANRLSTSILGGGAPFAICGSYQVMGDHTKSDSHEGAHGPHSNPGPGYLQASRARCGGSGHLNDAACHHFT